MIENHRSIKGYHWTSQICRGNKSEQLVIFEEKIEELIVGTSFGFLSDIIDKMSRLNGCDEGSFST